MGVLAFRTFIPQFVSKNLPPSPSPNHPSQQLFQLSYLTAPPPLIHPRNPTPARLTLSSNRLPMKLVDLRRTQERKAAAAARAAKNRDLQNLCENWTSCLPETPSTEPEASATEVWPPASPSTGTSPKRIAANRANAQLSTGPTSPEGKTASSRNAITTALTGRTVLLPSDDLALYQQHLESFFERLAPVGAEETALVQSLADIAWRLDRIAGLEMALFAAGELRFAEQFAAQPAPLRRRLIELEVYVAEEKRLRNLQIQEGRLCRRRERETELLRQLQQQRRSRESAELDRAAQLFQASLDAEQPFDPAAHGFDFSLQEIAGHRTYLEECRARRQAHEEEREAELSRLRAIWTQEYASRPARKMKHQ